MKPARMTPAMMIAATGRSCPASRQAKPAPTSAATPSRPAIVVGACASAMKRRSATTSRAMARPVMAPLSAVQRVLLNIGRELVLRAVLALVGVDDIAVAVIEDRGRIADAVELLPNRLVRIAVGRVRERQLAEERLSGSTRV